MYRAHAVHYFSSSPVIILGITASTKQLDNTVLTGIYTRWKQSRFYQKCGHCCIIHHPGCKLPEMPLVCNKINNACCSYIARHKRKFDDIVHFCNSSCPSLTDRCTSILATSEQEDKSNIILSPFEIGELVYINEGHTSSVHLRDTKQHPLKANKVWYCCPRLKDYKNNM